MVAIFEFVVLRIARQRFFSYTEIAIMNPIAAVERCRSMHW